MACGKSDVWHVFAMLSDFTNFYLFDQKKLAQELKRALKASKSQDLCHLSREFSRAFWAPQPFPDFDQVPRVRPWLWPERLAAPWPMTNP